MSATNRIAQEQYTRICEQHAQVTIMIEQLQELDRFLMQEREIAIDRLYGAPQHVSLARAC